MKKILFLLFAALLSGNVFAYTYAHRWVDEVEGAGHYTWNREYKYGRLFFEDRYHLGVARDRLYVIHIYERIPEKTGLVLTYDMDNPERYWYHYGEITPQGFRSTEITSISDQYWDCSGGLTKIIISDALEEVRMAGYTKLRLAIEVLGRTNVLTEWYPAETETVSDRPRGLFLNNYIDIDVEQWQSARLFGSNVATHDYPLELTGSFKAANVADYKFQESIGYMKDKEEYGWRTIESGAVSTKEARAGVTLNFKRDFNVNGEDSVYLYRLIVKNRVTGVGDTSDVYKVVYKYKFVCAGKEYDLAPNEKLELSKPGDCLGYSVVSDLPVEMIEKNNRIEFTMPACDVELTTKKKTYTVTYLNADYTWLNKVDVTCGDDATDLGPKNPEFGGFTFTGWSQDLTNVHSDMTVVAKYDVGANYWLNVTVSNHENKVFPFEGFADDANRAMVGDKLRFTADVLVSAEAAVYYETAQWNASEKRFLWDPNSGKKIGDYTDVNKERWFDQEISIAYDENTKYIHPFEHKLGVRFYLIILGQKIYSDPYEVDIYYPITIANETGKTIYAQNYAGDIVTTEKDSKALMPAAYNDTIRIIPGRGCLSFERVLYPERSLETGLDKFGNAYFVAPGEQETINVNVSKKLIVFDGVYSDGYPKQFDFTAEGFGKVNGYYAEVVPCSDHIQNMPEDPTSEGKIFLGWQAWNTDYDDDAYMNVPAISDPIIGFTAQWETVPAVPQYTVNFYDRHGVLLDTQKVNEGENAVPPAAPQEEGYHFVGWNKSFTTITEDKDIKALYGNDSKSWTVTYYDDDETTELGKEIVSDGEAAQGIEFTLPTGNHLKYWVLKNIHAVADLNNIFSDTEVYASYERNVYTITYTIDGNVVATEQVEYGLWPKNSKAIEEQVKPSTEQYVYTFDHWSPSNPAYEKVTEDATYEAVFTQTTRKYTVTFQNWDHEQLDKQEVEYGKAAVAPADPKRDGDYIFTGWDIDFSNVVTDMTVTAVFKKYKKPAIDSGICGMDGEGNLADNLTWTYDPENFSLTIEGSGMMMNYGWYPDEAPWIIYSDKIKTVSLPDGLTTIGESAFQMFYSLEDISIPNSVTSIGELAFEGSVLTSITIPDGVTSLGDGAFAECYDLASVVIPASITSIGDYTFWECFKLKEITNNATTPQALGADVFDYVDQANCKLYVPSGSVAAYKAAEVWKDFDIEGKEPQGVESIQQSEVSIQKVLRNGVLYITMPDVKIIDVYGKQVK